MNCPAVRFAFRFFFLGILFFALALSWGCTTYPVDTSGRNLLELESVWQYLKVYSIWQDSVPLPGNAFTYATPERLLASVNDTLHGYQYTSYDSLGGANAASPASASPVADVYCTAVSPRTAYIHLWTFSRDSTFDNFRAAVGTLAGFPNIMLDLRWNTGGDIATMDSIIEYFLPVNTPFIVATYRSYDAHGRIASTVRNDRWTTKRNRSPSLYGKNIVILMNHWSASASEMLAAGIKDGRASSATGQCPFVGDTSYGKGIGQVVVNRSQFRKPDIRITFLRVTRACGCGDSVYHRKGLSPDIRVTDSDSTVADTLQYLAAFHVLEPGIRPNVIIFTKFSKSGLAKEPDFTAPALPEFEK